MLIKLDSHKSASHQKSCHSSDSERHAESHRREGSQSSEGVHCKEEYFRQWSRKTQAFFAGVIKESEIALEWTAEQATESTQELIDVEFLPMVTNVERGVPNSEFVLQQVHTALMALTIYEANDTVANSRKNP